MAGRCLLLLAVAGFVTACARDPNNSNETVLTFSGSALGAEGTLVAKQLKQFMVLNPGIRVELQRTPDDASQRHQLYVQWLNARVGNPPILQLDVIWTPEFAAAGWVLPLTPYGPVSSDFFPATIEANTWAGKLYALPWFADVGLLYRRTDLVSREPATPKMVASARRRCHGRGPRYGIVWQGARYEGLITGFVNTWARWRTHHRREGRGRREQAEACERWSSWRRAVRLARRPARCPHLARRRARYAFQNGNAVFMRNWPTRGGDGRFRAVEGRWKFAVSPMRNGNRGEDTHRGLGRTTRDQRLQRVTRRAYKLIAYLTAP